MLSSIRNKTKGIFAYFIVALIVIPFALFGISEYSTGETNVAVAKVNDIEISKKDFLAIFNTNKRRLQESLGEKYTPVYEQQLKNSVINFMIDDRLLVDFFQKQQQAVSPNELQASIQTDDNFKENGVFSMEKYQRTLRINGYNYNEYEKNKTDDLMRAQIKSNLLDSAFVTEPTLKRVQQLNAQKRQFNYTVLKINDYLNAKNIDKADVQAFYERNKSTFFEPQKLKVDFVELSLTEIAKTIKVDDKDLLRFYEEEKARFTTEEERQAQHILFDSEQNAKKVADLLAKGGDFAKLAQAYSQDDASKNQGGDLGFFTKGVMTPEFEKQVFSMKVGEQSQPIKTEFGYHIIKLLAVHPATTKAFDADLRAKLRAIYTKKQAQKRWYALSEQLTNLAYETSLEEASEQMGLTLKTSEFFTRDSSQYAKKFIQAAFSNIVLNQNENSDLIELSKNKFVILRLKNNIPQRQKTFSEAKADIKAILAAQSAQKMMMDIAQKITQEFSTGNDKAAKALMKTQQLQWQEAGWVGRNSNPDNAVIINKVFALSKPQKNKATYGMVRVNPQRAVVIQLSKIKTPNYQPNNPIKQALLSLESEETMRAILINLKDSADIEIFQQHL